MNPVCSIGFVPESVFSISTFSKGWLLIVAVHPILENKYKSSLLPSLSTCVDNTLYLFIVHTLMEHLLCAILSAGNIVANKTVKLSVVKELTFYSFGWINSTSLSQGNVPGLMIH